MNIRWQLFFLLGVACAAMEVGVKAAVKTSQPSEPQAAFSWASHIDAQVDTRVAALITNKPRNHSFRADYGEILKLGPKAIPSLIPIAESETVDFKKRWVALMAAADLFASVRMKPGYEEWQRGFYETLGRFFKHPFSLIRTAAVKAVSKCGDSRFLPQLHLLLRDPTIVVRDEVVRTLAVLKDKRSLAELARALHSEQNYIRGRGLYLRKNILQSIALIGAAEATPVLMEIIKRKDSELTAESVRLLGLVNGDSTLTTEAAWLEWWEKKTSKRAIQ